MWQLCCSFIGGRFFLINSKTSSFLQSSCFIMLLVNDISKNGGCGSMKTVLLAEQSSLTRGQIEDYLIGSGYTVMSFENNEQLYDFYVSMTKDVFAIILDMVIPSRCGLNILEKISQNSLTPVIINSDIDSEQAKIRALKIGAYAYMSKPVSLQELGARVEGIDRRESLRHYDSIQLDSHNTKTIQLGNKALMRKLSQTEYKMLEYLVNHLDNVVPKEELLMELWGIDESVKTRVTDDTLVRIRKKLKDEAFGISVETVRGFGYIASYHKN